jgi:1-acyl-sn-glycerol-3-phosphate acyltransferase
VRLARPLRYPWSLWGLAWMGLLTGVGALVMVVLTWLKLSESSLQKVPRSWARLLMWGIGCPVRVSGLERLEPGATYVFASNHTSALDIPALLAVLPANFRWIAKAELFRIPVFGPALKRCGYIPIDRSDRRAAMQSLSLAARRIEAGASVLVFPEGTRSEDGRLLPFKSGGLALAIKSQRPVAPVAIAGARQVLQAHSLLLDPGPVRVAVGEPIPTRGLALKAREELAGRVQQAVGGLRKSLLSQP